MPARSAVSDVPDSTQRPQIRAKEDSDAPFERRAGKGEIAGHLDESELRMEIDRGAVAGVREVVGLACSVADPCETPPCQFKTDAEPAPSIPDDDPEEIPAGRRDTLGRGDWRVPTYRPTEGGKVVVDNGNEQNPIRVQEVSIAALSGVSHVDAITLVRDLRDIVAVRSGGRSDDEPVERSFGPHSGSVRGPPRCHRGSLGDSWSRRPPPNRDRLRETRLDAGLRQRIRAGRFHPPNDGRVIHRDGEPTDGDYPRESGHHRR
jgi:hypothetical protein